MPSISRSESSNTLLLPTPPSSPSLAAKPVAADGCNHSSFGTGKTPHFVPTIRPHFACILSVLGSLLQAVWESQKCHERADTVHSLFEAIKERISQAPGIPTEQQNEILGTLDGLKISSEAIEELEGPINQLLSKLEPEHTLSASQLESGRQACWQGSEEIQEARSLLFQILFLVLLTKTLHTCFHLFEQPKTSNPVVTPEIPSQPGSSRAAAYTNVAAESAAQPNQLDAFSEAGVGSAEKLSGRKSKQPKLQSTAISQTTSDHLASESTLNGQPSSSNSLPIPVRSARPRLSQSISTPNLYGMAGDTKDKSRVINQDDYLYDLRNLISGSNLKTLKDYEEESGFSSSDSGDERIFDMESLPRSRGLEMGSLSHSIADSGIGSEPGSPELRGRDGTQSDVDALKQIYQANQALFSRNPANVDLLIRSLTDQNAMLLRVIEEFQQRQSTQEQVINELRLKVLKQEESCAAEEEPQAETSALAKNKRTAASRKEKGKNKKEGSVEQRGLYQQEEESLRRIVIRPKRAALPQVFPKPQSLSNSSGSSSASSSTTVKAEVKEMQKTTSLQIDKLSQKGQLIRRLSQIPSLSNSSGSSSTSSRTTVKAEVKEIQKTTSRRIYESKQNNPWIHDVRSDIPFAPFLKGMEIRIPDQRIKSLPAVQLHSAVEPVPTGFSATTLPRVFLEEPRRRLIEWRRTSEKISQSNNSPEPSTPFHYAVLNWLYVGAEQIIGLLKRVEALEIWRVAERKEIEKLKQQIQELQSTQQQVLIAQRQAMLEAFEKGQAQQIQELSSTQQQVLVAQRQAMLEAFEKGREQQIQELSSAQQQVLIEQRQAMLEAFEKGQAQKIQELSSTQQQVLIAQRQAMLDAFAEKQKELEKTVAETLQAMQAQANEFAQKGVLSNAAVDLEDANKATAEALDEAAKLSGDVNRKVTELDGDRRRLAKSLGALNAQLLEGEAQVGNAASKSAELLPKMQALAGDTSKATVDLEAANEALADQLSSTENLKGKAEALTKDLARHHNHLTRGLNKFSETLSALEEKQKQSANTLEKVGKQTILVDDERSKLEQTVRQLKQENRNAVDERLKAEKNRRKVTDESEKTRKVTENLKTLHDDLLAVNEGLKKALKQVARKTTAASSTAQAAAAQTSELLIVRDALKAETTTAAKVLNKAFTTSGHIEAQTDKLDGQLLQISKLETFAQEVMRISDAVEEQAKLVQQNAEIVKTAGKQLEQFEGSPRENVTNVIGLIDALERKKEGRPNEIIVRNEVRRALREEGSDITKLARSVAKKEQQIAAAVATYEQLSTRVATCEQQSTRVATLVAEVENLKTSTQAEAETMERKVSALVITLAENVGALEARIRLLQNLMTEHANNENSEEDHEIFSDSLQRLERFKTFDECKDKVIELEERAAKLGVNILYSKLENLGQINIFYPGKFNILGDQISDLENSIEAYLAQKIPKLSSNEDTDTEWLVSALSFYEPSLPRPDDGTLMISEGGAPTDLEVEKIPGFNKRLANIEDKLDIIGGKSFKKALHD